MSKAKFISLWFMGLTILAAISRYHNDTNIVHQIMSAVLGLVTGCYFMKGLREK